MAEHPDIPALVARLEAVHDCIYSVSGSKEIDAHRTLRDAAAALSRLTRSLAERDDAVSYLSHRLRYLEATLLANLETALAAAERERDELRAKVESLELAAFDDLHNTSDAD